LGLAGVNTLGINEPAQAANADTPGLRAAVDFIHDLRQASDLSTLPVGRHVVVIGGGMTAIDAAVQAKLLGAETSTIVYRRGAAAMSASKHEQDWAQTQGVLIRHWATPLEVLLEGDVVSGVRFAHTALHNGQPVLTRETFTLHADMVLRAIGQTFVASATSALALHKGRILVDAHGRTTQAGVWAGGDCRFGGRDLTVEAVEHGTVAAQSIDAFLAQTTGA
jgi:dihydropyrimidine dehydrogenase (NAD+) subunit PreT